jgi:hypothetical protein
MTATDTPPAAEALCLSEAAGWPLRPLLDTCGLTASALARRVGVSATVVKVAARDGLSDHQADRWAIRIGSHPLLVWGWAWIDQADRAAGRPVYVRLAAAIRDQIVRGDLAPGDRLPSVHELAERWGVGTRTVLAAVKELRADGVLTVGGPRGGARVAATIGAGPAGCAACGLAIELGDEHYPHRPFCTLAARGWCDCDQATHPECCPSCAAGAS